MSDRRPKLAKEEAHQEAKTHPAPEWERRFVGQPGEPLQSDLSHPDGTLIARKGERVRLVFEVKPLTDPEPAVGKPACTELHELRERLWRLTRELEAGGLDEEAKRRYGVMWQQFPGVAVDSREAAHRIREILEGK